MSKPLIHAYSSAKKFGGVWEDYMDIHELMDSSKSAFPDNRHRCLTHNSWFIGFIIPKVFGETFARKSDGKVVSSRDIAEQHVLEDYKLRFIPTAQDFIQEMKFQPWMQNGMGEPPTSHKLITEMINESNAIKKTTRPIRNKSMVLDGRRGLDKYRPIIKPINVAPEEYEDVKSGKISMGDLIIKKESKDYSSTPALEGDEDYDFLKGGINLD